MPELIEGSEGIVTHSGWSFDTLRVYLLSHVVAAGHQSESRTIKVMTAVEHNDQRYQVEFNAIKELIHGVREAYALRDANLQSQVDNNSKRVEDIHRSISLSIEAGLSSSREVTQVAFAASEKAIFKAETANEKRFESVNEFRQTLTDQTASFMPRAQVEALLVNLNDKIVAISSRMDRSEAAKTGSSTGITQGWGYAVGVIGLILSLLGIMSFVANMHK
jgi:hypothetical protein